MVRSIPFSARKTSTWSLICILLFGLVLTIAACGATTVPHTPKSTRPPIHVPAKPTPSLPILTTLPPGAPQSSSEFAGIVTADGCASSTLPIGDVGCTITVNHTITVDVLHGNAFTTQPWGTTIGFGDYRANVTGKTVIVYANKLSPTSYSLDGSAAYYVKIEG